MKAYFTRLGYIGLPITIIAAKHGVEIAGVDINTQVMEVINQGKLHIIEPGTEEMSREILASGHFKVYTEPRVNGAYFVVVPTPFERSHKSDVSFVESVTRMVLPLLKERDLYVIESTSPVGTTEWMVRLVPSKQPELEGKVYIAYCPEWVLLDNVIYGLAHSDRVIDDMDKASTRKAIEFYGQFVEGMLHPMNSKIAEVCELIENPNRDVQIASANELSFICDKVGINVWGLTDLANKHPRVNILWLGCGVGGYRIAMDPYFITTESPMESRMISTARETNNYRVFWCAEKVRNAMLRFELKHGRRPAVAMTGLAFRLDIDDLRRSPAEGVTTKVLQSCNNADIVVVKPNVLEHKLFKLTPYKGAYREADIVVFLVSHREFAGLNYRDDAEVPDFYGTFKR